MLEWLLFDLVACALSALCRLLCSLIYTARKVGISPILYMWKLMLTEVKLLALDYTSIKHV